MDDKLINEIIDKSIEDSKKPKEAIGTAEGFGTNDYKFFERQVEKQFKGTLHSEVDSPIGIGCGSYRVDMALSQAFPLGYMHEVFAQNSVGKTTFVLEVLGQHQQKGGLVGYLDVEGSLNKSLVQSIQTLDINKKDANGNPLWIYKEAIVQDNDSGDSREMTGEECLRYVEIFISTFKNSVLAIDSVDALVPEAILLGKEIGEKTIGKLAFLLSDACRRFKGILKKNNNALIWINQIRENPGKMFGDPEVTPGGNAIRFYSVQRLKLMRGEGKDNFEKDENGNILGHLVKIKVVKNKLPTTNNEPFFWIKYGQGIDRARELAELALELGIVELDGKSYYFNRGTKEELKIIGKDKAMAYIQSNKSVMDDIAKKVIDLVGIPR
jgi:recombination protein RecA